MACGKISKNTLEEVDKNYKSKWCVNETAIK